MTDLRAGTFGEPTEPNGGEPLDRRDFDGNPCTLSKLCGENPMWAANRLRCAEKLVTDLEAKLKESSESARRWESRAEGLEKMLELCNVTHEHNVRLKAEYWHLADAVRKLTELVDRQERTLTRRRGDDE